MSWPLAIDWVRSRSNHMHIMTSNVSHSYMVRRGLLRLSLAGVTERCAFGCKLPRWSAACCMTNPYVATLSGPINFRCFMPSVSLPQYGTSILLVSVAFRTWSNLKKGLATEKARARQGAIQPSSATVLLGSQVRGPLVAAIAEMLNAHAALTMLWSELTFRISDPRPSAGFSTRLCASQGLETKV